MPYAVGTNAPVEDQNDMRYVGWGYANNSCYDKLFHPNTIRTISHKVSELLEGVDPNGRKIVVTERVIRGLISDLYEAYRPQTGDIYTRYIIPPGSASDFGNQYQSIIDQTIEVITNNIRNEIGIIENNQKLSAWVQVMGEGVSSHGLQAHSQLNGEIRKKNTNYRGMISFMTY